MIPEWAQQVARQRCGLKRCLRRRGVPFYEEASLDDLRKLVDVTTHLPEDPKLEEGIRHDVRLTVREQDVLALLMQVLTDFVYDWERSDLDWDSLGPVGQPIAEWWLKTNVKSQELGAMYDVMHRTGGNARI